MESLHLQNSISKVTLLVFMTSLTVASPAFADEKTSSSEMEEVTVYGEKSLLNLKRALIKAEDTAFDLFNSLNTDYRYDIQCEKRKPLGSNIPRRICYPNYINELENEAADRWRGSGKDMINKNELPLGPIIVSVPKQIRMQKNMREIMDKLKLEHPELAEALDAYSKAKHRYVTAMEEK